MMALLIISLSLISILLLLISMRIRLVVDTEKANYMISAGYLFSLKPVWDEYNFRIEMKVLFLKFSLNPMLKGAKASTEVKNKRKKNKPKSFRKQLKLAAGIFKSLSIKHIDANIDTGNYPLNAQLMAFVYPFSKENVHININFNDINQVSCEVETSPYRVLKNLILQ